jgi:hypothetical protein
MDIAAIMLLSGRSSDALESLSDALRLYEQKGNIVSAARARRLLEQLRLNE